MGRCFVTIYFRLCFEYAIMRAYAGQDGFKLNGTHQLLVYANDSDDLVGEDNHNMNKSAATS
jgi:hypothetical protein